MSGNAPGCVKTQKVNPGVNVNRFPVRAGNSFSLLVNAPEYYPAMLQAIRDARRYVLMEMYLVESGHVADDFVGAFAGAVQRGVTVQLLLDAFGARAFSGDDRERLARAGVELAFYNPLQLSRPAKNLLRTHRKFLIVDGVRAFVGGAGIADVFSGQRGWRDTVLEIRGAVVQDWHMLFSRSWREWATSPAAHAAAPLSESKNQRGRVACTARGTTHLEIQRILINRVRHSRRRVWLATAYFVPSRKIRRVLRKAAFRGVDTRLLLPGPITDHPAVRFASRRFYARLLRYGVRIYEYSECFMHSKVVLVDDWCSIGSSNMDRWNLRWNLEANQEVEDGVFAGEVEDMLHADFSHSSEIDYRQWRQRSGMQRIKEWMWGKMDIFLAQFMPGDKLEGDEVKNRDAD